MTEETITQSFTIHGSLPGMNEMINAAKTKLRSRSRSIKTARGTKYELLKREAGKAVFAAIQGKSIKPMSWAVVSIHWRNENKKKDPDNVAAGIKVVLDSLVEAGILENDGWKHIHPPITHTWEVDTLHPRVIVTLEGPERKG